MISDSPWIRHGYCKPICILIFLHGPLHPNCMNLSRVSIHNHCFHVSGHQIKWLDDSKPEIKIQIEGHILTPTSGRNGPEDPEAFGSAPSCSLSLSLARKPTPDWPETWYCLEIQVISTEYDKEIPSTPHMWQVPIVKDMVREGEAGLTRSCIDWPRKGYLVL